jgi:hypothetical protein
MTEPVTPATPFVMVGDPDAAVCVDDTCGVPQVSPRQSAQAEPQVSASQITRENESGSS